MGIKSFMAKILRRNKTKPFVQQSPGDLRELSNRMHDRRPKIVNVSHGTAVPKAESFDTEGLAKTASDMRIVNFSSEEDALADGDKNANYNKSKE